MTALVPLSRSLPHFRKRRSGEGHSSWDAERDVLTLDERSGEFTRLAHELQHFWFSIGTPYGQFVNETALFRRACVQQYVDGCGDGVVAYPAYWIALQFNSCQRTLKKVGMDCRWFKQTVIPQFIAPWSQARHIELIMEGDYSASVFDTTTAKASQFLNKLESNFTNAMFAGDGLPPPPIAVSAGEYSQISAVPTIGVKHRRRPLIVGGAAIMESVAQLVEGMAPARDVAVDYLGLFTWFLARTKVRLDDGRAVRRAVRTFLCLAELALFTPIGVIYSRLRLPAHTWKDVHPGHRFLQTVDHFVQHPQWVRRGSNDHADLQDEISDQLGWPRPTAFMEAAARVSFNLFDRHAAAMMLKAEHPRIWVAEAMREIPILRRLINSHAPMIIDHSGHIRPSTDDILSKARDFTYVTALFGIFFFTGNLWPQHCLPDWLGRTARRLVQQAIEAEWLKPSRFVRISID